MLPYTKFVELVPVTVLRVIEAVDAKDADVKVPENEPVNDPV